MLSPMVSTFPRGSLALARQRLPEWADRIWVGNVMEWTPPRRFDVVHTGIDYVPRDRRRDLLKRVLRDLVEPGGRIVLRANRVHPRRTGLGHRDPRARVRHRWRPREQASRVGRASTNRVVGWRLADQLLGRLRSRRSDRYCQPFQRATSAPAHPRLLVAVPC